MLCKQYRAIFETEKVWNGIDASRLAAGIITAIGARGEQYIEKQFEGGGITFLAILSKSHLSIHTWPEYNRFLLDICASIDFFPETILKIMRENGFELISQTADYWKMDGIEL